MKDIMDLHTHTLASGHAFNSMLEMVDAAILKGIQLFGITDHAPAMPGGAHEYHFECLKLLPRTIKGLSILHGAECNILTDKGELDIENTLLEEMDIVIASIHGPCIRERTREYCTNAIIATMDNPYVNIIGHPDDSRFPLEYEPIVKKAKEKGILLEVNNSSLMPVGFRKNARENYIKMLTLCKEQGVSIIINSDAHYIDRVGLHENAWEVIKEVDFPEELIVNTSIERFRKFVNKG